VEVADVERQPTWIGGRRGGGRRTVEAADVEAADVEAADAEARGLCCGKVVAVCGAAAARGATWSWPAAGSFCYHR